MKLIKFVASEVHGYLDFDVVFNPDVNFFAGLNGSGKTTALKMIMAILTPSIEQMVKIDFKNALLLIEDRNKTIEVYCEKSNESINITLIEDGDLVGTEIIYLDKRDSMNGHSFRFSDSQVIKNIRRLTSPIFLSLDRRFIKPVRDDEKIYSSTSYRHDGMLHFDNPSRYVRTGDESLDEILSIVVEANGRARSRQAKADNRLRDNIILDSLAFSEAGDSAHFPDRKTLQSLKTKQLAIKKTLFNLDVSSESFESKFDEFFSKFEIIVKKMEVFDDVDSAFFKRNELSDDFNEALSEWFMNQNQLKRIDRLFLMVEKYQLEKRTIYKDINRLEGLVNKFLSETGKSISINSLGQMKIKFSGGERDLSVLSSGERQILIMLVHLTLDRKLKNGVFIIDEPELSLHISWQDMFVASVQEANPNLQLILATHSPAIIGGRNHMYVPLNGKS